VRRGNGKDMNDIKVLYSYLPSGRIAVFYLLLLPVIREIMALTWLSANHESIFMRWIRSPQFYSRSRPLTFADGYIVRRDNLFCILSIAFTSAQRRIYFATVLLARACQ